MVYVDGYVLPVPKKKIKAYKAMARMGAKMWRKHGALDYKECVADDLFPKMKGFHPSIRFPNTVKAKPNETVVFSFIVYKSRAHRDAVNAKVMKDPAMNDPKNKDMEMPFDMKRMVYGGFKVIVDA
ncbi:MAG: DUF1428 domain-containing protein [Candidatus Norongarragalinales archaeon]